jgi:hypothetical protein
MAHPADLTGQVFGKLTAIKRVESDSKGHAQWQCQCVCGAFKIVRAHNLKGGGAQSCGACGAVHLSGTPQSKMKFRVQTWGTKDMGQSAHCWGEAIRIATGEMVLRTNSPRYRLRNKGEPFPGVLRLMTMLADAGHINGQNNRTVRRWIVEEGIECKGQLLTDIEVDAAWYERTGEKRPDAAPLASAQSGEVSAYDRRIEAETRPTREQLENSRDALEQQTGRRAIIPGLD